MSHFGFYVKGQGGERERGDANKHRREQMK